MRRRQFFAASGLAAGGLAVSVGGTTRAAAAPVDSPVDKHRTASPRSDSLRDLAARIGLHIGTAVTPFDLVTPAYTDVLATQFSAVTPENELKWQVVEPTRGVFDWSGADNLVAFAEAHGQLVRGHTLLWHSQLPTWLTDGVSDGSITKAQLMELLHQHILTEVGRYRGRIWQWDVANEFFTDTNPSMINPDDFWISNLGEQIIPQAFRWAHQADPHALLFYNDYNIAGEDGSNAKSDAAFAFVRGLKQDGVPIHGVGNQGHLDTQFGFPTMMQADLERFTSLGLRVAITEADVRTNVDGPTTQVPTDALAAGVQPFYYDQMFKAALAVPDLLSFTVWGFGDSESWVPGTFAGEGFADLYDVDLNPKPAFTVLQQDLQAAVSPGPRHRSN